MALRIVLAASVAIAIGAPVDAQRTLRVPELYASIGAAMANAGNGDTILVAPGTYRELVDFTNKAVWLRSTHGASVTTIDGRGQGATVTFGTAAASGATLDGFTVTGGFAGGVRCIGGAPTVANCTVVGNQAQQDCTCFLDCIVTAYGGGIYVSGAARIVDCTVQNNICRADRSAACGPVRLATARGGGIYARGPARIERCLLIGNRCTATADTPGGTDSAHGGAASLDPAGRIASSAIFYNSADGAGAGVIGGSLVNSIVIGNRTFAPRAEGSGLDAVIVANSIIRENNPDRTKQIRASQVSYCNLDHAYPGAGNFVADPKFLDLSYHLAADSPCIDRGSNSANGLPTTDYEGDPRVVGGAPDIGADEFFARVRVQATVRPGGQATFEIHGTPGKNTVLGFATKRLATPLAFPGVLGTLALDPFAMALLPLGPMPAGGVLTFPYRFAPTFPPVTIWLQAAVDNQVSGLEAITVQ